MRNAILVAVLATVGFSTAALAEGKKIGVSWAQFQEERWKIDEAAMKAAIEAAGNEYISADAQTSATKQLADIEGMITQGCSALIILAGITVFLGAQTVPVLQDQGLSFLTSTVWDSLGTPPQYGIWGMLYGSILLSVIALVIAVINIHPPIVLFSIFVAYGLSGYVVYGWRRAKGMQTSLISTSTDEPDERGLH